MPLIENTFFGKVDKVKQAIERIKAFDPVSTGLFDLPYYVAYSGGKDSDVLRILFELAGVKYDLIHHLTTVDAPETIYYVRSIPKIQIEPPQLTMWRLIEKKKMPPTRVVRYCCEYLKERGGKDRFVVTGVRWAESPRRKIQRGIVEVQTKNIANKLILNSDNDIDRRMLEVCQMKGKRILNPVIDWLDSDIWEFLQHYNCLSNPLYQQGFSRIGCIGCPLAGPKVQQFEFARYPIYKDNYIKAFDRMVTAQLSAGLPTAWKNGQDVFSWWLAKHLQADENQMTLY